MSSQPQTSAQERFQSKMSNRGPLKFGPMDAGPVAIVSEQLEGNKGTVTSADRKRIFDECAVDVTVRNRGRGKGRVIELVGRSDNLKRAWHMALGCLEEHGCTGGRKTSESQHVQRKADKALQDAIRRRRSEGAHVDRACENQLRDHVRAQGAFWSGGVSPPEHDTWASETGYVHDTATGLMWPDDGSGLQLPVVSNRLA